MEDVDFRINGRKAFRHFLVLLFSYVRMRNDTPPSLASTRARISIMSSFPVESMVRGYHVHKDIRDAVGEEFLCKREDGNRVDSFAVDVAKFNKISKVKIFVDLIFIWRGIIRNILKFAPFQYFPRYGR